MRLQTVEKPQKHFVIDVSEKGITKKQLEDLKNEDWLIKMAGGEGLIFSNHVLNYYLDEEYRHGKTILTSGSGLLKTKSSGERKKLLLDYLLEKSPKFLILDNPFDSLDKEKVTWFKKKLETLSQTTLLIQLFRRREDILPFYNSALVYSYKGFSESKLKKHYLEMIDAFKTKHEIPTPIARYESLPKTLVAFKDVSVSFGDKPVIDRISWEIEQGETWHLKGPNGSGKTTLLSMITGDNTKGYGKELYIFGRKKGSGESVWEIKQKIGYFTASMTERFDGMHSVLEMVISGLHDSVGLYKKPTTLEILKAEEWIDIIGLSTKKDKTFRALDEVQKRLVLIARAMIKHPPMLILDEPTSSLNSTGAVLLVNLINKVAEGSNTAILYVSHREEKGLKFKNSIELRPSQNGSRAVIVRY